MDTEFMRRLLSKHIHRSGYLAAAAQPLGDVHVSVDPIDKMTLSSGSSFPADSAKPVPLAVVSLDSR